MNTNPHATPFRILNPGPDPIPDVNGFTFGRIEVPDWIPPSLNEFVGKPFAVAHKLKKETAEMLCLYAYSGRPRPKFVTASFRPVRSVGITLYTNRTIDPDNILKVTLDAMKRAALIVDDSPQWCNWSVFVSRSDRERTVIELRDTAFGAAIRDQDDPAFKRMVTRLKNKGSKNVKGL